MLAQLSELLNLLCLHISVQVQIGAVAEATVLVHP
jgi:hypothetical protein